MCALQKCVYDESVMTIILQQHPGAARDVVECVAEHDQRHGGRRHHVVLLQVVLHLRRHVLQAQHLG